MKLIGVLSAGAVAVAMMAALPAAAQTKGAVAVGLGWGSDGIGPDVHVQVAPQVVLSARAALSMFRYHQEGSVNGFYLKGNAKISGVSAQVDLHPWTQAGWMQPMFVAVGVMGGDRNVKIKGSYTGSPIAVGGGQTANAAGVGAVTGTVHISDVSPLVGVGWDDSFTTSRAFGVRLFAGLALADTDVALSASGGQYSNAPAVQQALSRAEHPTNSSNLKYIRYFPQVSASLTYRF